jgi:hypothetical protein
MTAREAPRVPFAALVERGLVVPGITLVDAKKRHQALVRADGALAFGETVGSIHRIGALAQGLEVQRLDLLASVPQELTVIDTRARVRAEWAWSSRQLEAVPECAQATSGQRFNKLFPQIAFRISLRSCGLLVEPYYELCA